jgi:hypothetical protein
MKKWEYAQRMGLSEFAIDDWVDERFICNHCGRVVEHTDDGWADLGATGDDEIWRLVCDENDSFVANHEGTEVGA